MGSGSRLAGDNHDATQQQALLDANCNTTYEMQAGSTTMNSAE
jgi:hypothetical protein